MSELYSLVDMLGQYLASVVPQKGRAEVQIYPLLANPGPRKPLIDEANISRHELRSHLAIAAVTWLNEQTIPAGHSKKKGLKRTNLAGSGPDNGITQTHTLKPPKNHEKPTENGSRDPPETPQPLPLLAVALLLANMWTFSPKKDTPVAKVAVPETMICLVAAQAQNRVWALGNSAAIYEINVLDGDVVRTAKYGAPLLHTAVISACTYQPKGMEEADPDSELLYVASTKLHLVDAAHPAKPFLAEFRLKNKSSAKSKESVDMDNRITRILNPDKRGLHLVVTRANLDVLTLCGTKNRAQNPVFLQCGSPNIRNIRTLGGVYVVACTAQGADFFAVRGDISSSPVATMRPQHDSRVFENFYYASKKVLVGVWYDGNQPKFTRIPARFPFEGTYEIPLDAPAEVPVDANESPVNPDKQPVPNMPADKLLHKLSALLSADKTPPKAVIALCTANDIEDSIRWVVRQLAYVENCAQLVETLFEIVSARIAQDASHNLSLPVWLRWLLLVYGGLLIKEKRVHVSLHALQRSLSEGMESMGTLLALQGRLQLLKSQADLRGSMANGTVAEDSDATKNEQKREYDALNETFNNSMTTNIEESVVYADGENDDFEDAFSTAFNENRSDGAEIVAENGSAMGEAMNGENGEAE